MIYFADILKKLKYFNISIFELDLKATNIPREMSVKHIMIRDLEPQYNAEYIANYFWKKEIAKVSSVTIIPYILDGKILGIAYIEFDSFCETEAAAEFIYNMTGVVGYMIGHAEPEEENIWVLEPNTHNEGHLCVGEYTTTFMPDFFETYEDANYHLCSQEEFHEKYPIKGLKNNRYTVDEAISYLWVLNLQWEQETDPEKKRQIAIEIYEIDTATKLHISWENNSIAPFTVEYSEELNDIFGELGEAEWRDFMSWQTSLPRPQRETNEWHFQAQEMPFPPPPGLQRREVAMSVDEYHILHSEKPPRAEYDEETYCMDDEESKEFDCRYPIRGLDGVYYSFEGALEHLWVLNQDWDYTEDKAEKIRIEKEIDHFEIQMQKYIATQDNNLELVESCIKISREIAGEAW